MPRSARAIAAARAAFSGHNYMMVLMPALWDTFSRAAGGVRLTWQEIPFRGRNADRITADCGVYAFVLRPKIGTHRDHCYLMYVGSADNLRRRFREYLREKDSRRGRTEIVFLLRTYAPVLWFTYAAVANGTQKDIETALYTAMWPPCNTMGKAIPGMLDRTRLGFS